MSEPTINLRERTIEITTEYWDAREKQSERVAVAQLALALARTESERDAALARFSSDTKAGT